MKCAPLPTSRKRKTEISEEARKQELKTKKGPAIHLPASSDFLRHLRPSRHGPHARVPPESALRLSQDAGTATDRSRRPHCRCVGRARRCAIWVPLLAQWRWRSAAFACAMVAVTEVTAPAACRVAGDGGWSSPALRNIPRSANVLSARGRRGPRKAALLFPWFRIDRAESFRAESFRPECVCHARSRRQCSLRTARLAIPWNLRAPFTEAPRTKRPLRDAPAYGQMRGLFFSIGPTGPI